MEAMTTTGKTTIGPPLIQIGEVASFSDPSKWYPIVRVGTPKAEGGPGTRWHCGCPSRLRPCKHLLALWGRTVPEGHERLTPQGLALLGPPRPPSAPLDFGDEPTSPGPMTGAPVLHTIGHGSRDLQDFLGQLERAGVKLLVDVRSFPGSRWSPQFDKRNLARPGATGAIRYLHKPELGGYNQADKSWPKTKDREWWDAIAWLADRVGKESVAMFCMETDYTKCHRHSQVQADLAKVAPHIQVVHLAPPSRAPKSNQLGLKV